MPSKYQMWITYNGGAEKIRFPVLPERLNVRQGMNNQSVNIQGLGELVIMQDPAAMVITFSSFFPAEPFPGVQFEALAEPMELAERIAAWKKGDRPIQFMITGTSINKHFTIEDFPWHESGGDIGTIHYSLTLKEYRETSVRQVTVAEEVAIIPEPAPARVDNRAPEQTHEVVRGDTLSAIARRHLGSANRWPEIAELNRDIVPNPNLIFPGQVLRLPAA